MVGIGFTSYSAVAELGLATASRFRKLAEHRSGVQFPRISLHETHLHKQKIAHLTANGFL
jgi:hypothetical protein